MIQDTDTKREIAGEFWKNYPYEKGQEKLAELRYHFGKSFDDLVNESLDYNDFCAKMEGMV